MPGLLVSARIGSASRFLATLERRLRDDGEALRRALTELDQGLRREVADSAARGFAAAFDKVQAGGREQGVVLQRFNAATQASLTELRTEIADRLRAGFDRFAEQHRAEQEQLRARVDQKLEAIRSGNEAKLEQMRAAVDEQLQSALEKRVGESFKQVAEQFAQVQQAIGQVQTVAGQVGDLKRLFSNVKARGVWGEAQLDAVLEDVLPHGYERNFRVREGSGEAVEFALRMPLKDRDDPIYLPIDSKFPTEDYDRLLLAADAADKEAEQAARRALERRIRDEAGRISGKYIVPPRTVDFAIMYLPDRGPVLRGEPRSRPRRVRPPRPPRHGDRPEPAARAVAHRPHRPALDGAGAPQRRHRGDAKCRQDRVEQARPRPRRHGGSRGEAQQKY